MFFLIVFFYGNNCIDKFVIEDILFDFVNFYVEIKLMGEWMIYWMVNCYNWKYVIFCYFNVVGVEMDVLNGLWVKNLIYIILNINKIVLG